MRQAFWAIGLFLLLAGLATPALGQNAPDTDAVNDILAAGSQTVALGDVLMNEPFDNDQNWPEWDDSNMSASLNKGTYHMTVEGKFYSWQLSPDTYQDVVLQVEARPVSKSTTSEYGLTCRSASDSGAGYYFLVAADGYYSILKLSNPDDGRQEVVKWDTSDFINQGQKGNTITVVCAGDYLALYANGHLLAETHDNEFSEGYAGLTVGGYEDNVTNDIAFDNLTIWEASAETGLSKESGATITLENYDGEPEDAIAELRSLGFVPKGGSVLFREDRAYFSGQGNFFTPLARRSPKTNVVMAGELTFSVGNENEYEECSLLARVVTDNSGTATAFVDVSLDNSGEILLYDLYSQKNDPYFYAADETFPVDKPFHLLFTLIGDRANVFVNGRLLIADVEVEQRSGSFGISLIGKGPGANCEGRNIWVYELPE